MGTLGEIEIVAFLREPSVKTDEGELVSLGPLPTVCGYLGLEDLDGCHDVIERVMGSFEGMAVVAGVRGGEVIMHFLAVLIDHAGCVNTLQEEGVVPSPSFESEGKPEAREVVVKDRRIVAVAVIGEEIATIGEGDEVVIHRTERDTVLQQEGFGYMMHRLGFRRDGELPFGEDIPIAGVDYST